MTNSNSTLIYRGKRLSVEQALRQVSALLDKNEFIAAEPLAREIVKVEPKLDAALQMLGISLSEQADPHKLSEALQYCRAAVEINPSSPHLKNVLANALTRAGQFTEAEQIFAEALFPFDYLKGSVTKFMFKEFFIDYSMEPGYKQFVKTTLPFAWLSMWVAAPFYAMQIRKIVR